VKEKIIKIIRNKKHIHPHLQKIVLISLIVLSITLVYLSVFDFSKPEYPNVATAQTVWKYDLYNSSGVRWQNPDLTACTAATAQMALNMIAISSTGNPPPFKWTSSTSYATQETVLSYERSHMTTPLSSKGSDPHGERNALNYFGWGSQNSLVYKDVAYTSFAAAAKGIVSSIAKTHKPAIVYPWGGAHAQIITGYQVTGEDPAISDNYTVTGIYLTDPLQRDGYRDLWVTLGTWVNGNSNLRFVKYAQTDPTGKDPIDGQVGKAEWYGKWVAVQAVNNITTVPVFTSTTTSKPDPCTYKIGRLYVKGGYCPTAGGPVLYNCSGKGTTISQKTCKNGCRTNKGTYDTCK
jgi:hypothetical protein